MANVVAPFWKKLLQIVDPADLAEDGLEKDAHITIMYGIEPDVKDEDIIKIVQDWPRPEITLQELGVFENKEFDVLKVNVESFDLGVCRQLALALPNHQDFQLFQPHMTLAYLKPGMGQKYLGLIDSIDPASYSVSNFEISMSSGKKFSIQPKFVILNYEKFSKAISHEEFKKLNGEKTGLVSTVLDSAFISGHTYHNKAQQKSSGLAGNTNTPQSTGGYDSTLS